MTLAAAALIASKGHNPDIGNVDPALLQTYERVQQRFGRELPINSGFRSPKRNFAAGGAKRSQHMNGAALDIDVRDLSKEDRKRLIQIASEEGITGIGVYGNALHFDSGPRRAWGPTFKSKSIPGWARQTVGQHLYEKFQKPETQVAQVSGSAGDDTLTGQGEAPKGSYFSDRLARQRKTDGKSTAPTAAEAGGYFSQRFARERAQSAPEPDTTSPAMPTGMNEPRQPGMIERAGQAVVGLVQGDAEFDVPEIESDTGAMLHASGLGKFDGDPNAPEFGPELKGLSKLRSDLILADGEDAMANIIQKHNPDIPIEADRNGNLYAIVNGERYALDKSGLSGRDATEFVKGLFTAMTTFGGAKVGRLIAGPAGRVAGAGAGAGGEQALEQVASNAVGGGQEFDSGRVMLGAAFGIGGETLSNLAEWLGPKMMNAIAKAKAGSKDQREFELAIEAQGFSVSEVQDALSKGLARTEAADLGPEALARIADAKSLPAPVDLTTGQATRSPQLFREEHMAGAFDEKVGLEAEGRRAVQQQALGQNAKEMTAGLSMFGDRSERGEAVQSALIKRRDAAWAKVGDAYNRARKAPNQPNIPQENLISFIDDTQKRLRKEYTPAPDDVTQRMIADFRETASEGPVSIGELERWRSRAVRDRETAKGGDRAALNELIRAYDGAIQSGLASGATGDASAIGLWRRAVRQRAEFGKTFENDSIVDRITRGAKKRRGEVDIDSADVMTELLGQSGFNKKGAAREALRLRQFLGKDSPEWGAVQAEGLVKLLGFEPSNFAGGNVSTKIVNNLRRARDENPKLLRALFSENQLSAIQRFARVVENTSIPPKDAGTPNASGSGLMTAEAAGKRFEQVKNVAQSVANMFGGGGRLVGTILLKTVTGATNAVQADAMRRSLQGLPLQPRRGPAFPGAGGAVGSQTGEQFSSQ
jgi:hypothetical protein